MKLTKKQKQKGLLREKELQELRLYQIELIKFQQELERIGRGIVVIFEGRDASGKGGTIRRILADLNPKHARVIATAKPTTLDNKKDFFQRYSPHFPADGEMVLFDRSWYNRTMVEPALKFCTKEEYEDFIPRIPQFEKLYFNNNSEKKFKCKPILLKFYFSITKEEQEKRFNKRQTNDRKKWKFSEADAQSQENWEVFSDLKYQMLKKTNTPSNPWDIIKSNDKHLARITAMKLILRSLKTYEGKNTDLDLKLDEKVWTSGNVELTKMKANRDYD
jgi:polyphosphate kinase